MARIALGKSASAFLHSVLIFSHVVVLLIVSFLCASHKTTQLFPNQVVLLCELAYLITMGNQGTF